jgi:hypothetical protein
MTEDAPAQRGEDIDGLAAQRIEYRRGGDKTRGERDREGCEGGAQPGRDHDRAAQAQLGGKRSSRLMTGVLPALSAVLALAFTLKVTVRLPRVAV